MRADQWSPRLQPRSPVAPVSGGRSCHGRFQRRQRRASLGAAVVPGPPDPRSEAVKTPAPSALAPAGRSPCAESGRRGRNLARGRPQRAVHAVSVAPRHPRGEVEAPTLGSKGSARNNRYSMSEWRDGANKIRSSRAGAERAHASPVGGRRGRSGRARWNRLGRRRDRHVADADRARHPRTQIGGSVGCRPHAPRRRRSQACRRH